jgi:hypothetical protein
LEAGCAVFYVDRTVCVYHLGTCMQYCPDPNAVASSLNMKV